MEPFYQVGLGFIDRLCVKPTGGKEELEQWQRADRMVVSCIPNSLTKDIAEAFLYTNSVTCGWNKEARFVEVTQVTPEKLVSNCTGIEGGKTLMERKRRNGVVGPRAFNANSEVEESGSQRGGVVTNNGANLLLGTTRANNGSSVDNIFEMAMEGAKFEVVKFDGTENFRLCQARVKDLLAQQGILKLLQPHKPTSMDDEDWDEHQQRTVGTIRLCLADEIMYHVINLKSPGEAVWTEDVGGFRFGAACERLQLGKRQSRLMRLLWPYWHTTSENRMQGKTLTGIVYMLKAIRIVDGRHMKIDCPKLKKQANEKRDDSSKSMNVVQNDKSDCSDGDMLSV
ncbi:Retrovirus-related Pol polyprotein from transposon TNT 1-94 [Sesamum angolense]|uniref:Retrovirus-related Pol polyprotein from transposon TNT 1-94 n=1 Tax=Sesamum angolense TaxID=2727404 RepID=A0AAE2BLE4_9LAMI|nr:Retrovirus-related Pol polyprotein from transposon TNT 1-94 [Sesamum angolense]